MNWDLILYLLENFTILKCKNKNFQRTNEVYLLEENAPDLPDRVYVAASDLPAARFSKALVIYPENVPINSANYISLSKGTPAEILNCLLKALSHLSRLSQQLSLVTGNQEVIDLAEEITGHPLFYFDSSYRILAISSRTDFKDDKEWQHMQKKGFLSPESVRLMQESGDLDLLADKVDPFPYDASYFPFQSLVCNIWNEQIFYSRLNMLCLEGAPTQLNIEECRIICSALLRIARSAGEQLSSIGPLNSMVLDLLRGLQLSEELIYDRLGSVPTLRDSLVQVCCMEPNVSNDHQVLNYYTSLLGQIFAGDSVVILEFDEKILLILHAPDRNAFQVLHEKLSSLLKAQKLKCGASNVFRRFSDLRNYYLQALSTLSMARQRQGLVHFEEIYFDYVLSFIPRNQAVPMISYDIIHLLNLQRDYQFPLAQTLRQYLECGCNLQLTAEKLYIHKNTALYRLNHIRELIDADLEDSGQQMQLLFSFRILDKYPVHL